MNSEDNKYCIKRNKLILQVVGNQHPILNAWTASKTSYHKKYWLPIYWIPKIEGENKKKEPIYEESSFYCNVARNWALTNLGLDLIS